MRNFSFFTVKWYGKSRNCIRMCGFAVAPLAGAWIESPGVYGRRCQRRKSHPSRVRGLKVLMMVLI